MVVVVVVAEAEAEGVGVADLPREELLSPGAVHLRNQAMRDRNPKLEQAHHVVGGELNGD